MDRNIAELLTRLIHKAIQPLQNRIRSIANRASITAVDDSGAIQKIQVTVLAGERLANVLRLQGFGFSANPPKGSSGLLISFGGSRTHTVFLAGESADRKSGLEAGESTQYNQWGDFVYLTKDGITNIKARSKVLVDAPEGECTGNWTIDGNLRVKGDSQVDGASTGTGMAHYDGPVSSAESVTDPTGSMQDMRDVYNGHHQPISGGTANPPTEQMT